MVIGKILLIWLIISIPAGLFIGKFIKAGEGRVK
jgi:hypothetical protein